MVRLRLSVYHLRDLTGMRCFPEQLRKRWDLIVPFDQSWLRPEAAKRISVQIPRRGGNRSRVRVDQELSAGSRFVLLGCGACHMGRADSIAGRMDGCLL